MNPRNLWRLSLLVLSVLFFSPGYAGWMFQDIYVPGSLVTRTTDINNSGAIVGYYHDPAVYRDIGFIMQNGELTTIPMQDPWGINNLGTIVGFNITDDTFHGALLSNGILTQVDFPDALGTQLFGINDAGVAIGTFWTATQTRAFTYSNGNYSLVDLNGGQNAIGSGIDNQGNIYGFGTVNKQAFELASDGTLMSLNYVYPGSTGTTYMFRANDLGQIVGWGSGPGVADRAYVYEGGNFIPLDYPASPQIQAYGINDSGDVVGHWWDISSDQGHGFLAIRSEAPLLESESSVPEPATLGLLAIGLAGLVMTRRKTALTHS